MISCSYAIDLFKHVADRLAASRIIAGQRILALKPCGRDRVPDFVRNACSDPAKPGQAFRTRRTRRHQVRLLARFGEAKTGLVQRVDDLIQFPLAGAGNDRHPLDASMSQGAFNATHMPPPNDKCAP